MLCIAHRGGAALYPENTLAAFRHAAAIGCDGAELDVQLSSDGEVVVYHDFCLNPETCRDTNGAWLQPPTSVIKDMTLAELQGFDIGRPQPDTDYARSHPVLRSMDEERIPTLEQVIGIARSAPRPFRLFIELKTSFADCDISADPKALSEAVLRVLRAHDYLGKAVLVGFDWRGLLHAKRLEPDIEYWFSTHPQNSFGDEPPPQEDNPPPDGVLQMERHLAHSGTSPWAAGYDAVKYGGSILRAIKAAGADGWFPMYRELTPEAVREARDLGLRVGAWTVDNPGEMQRLVYLDVDAICTDRPDLLRRIANPV